MNKHNLLLKHKNENFSDLELLNLLTLKYFKEIDSVYFLGSDPNTLFFKNKDQFIDIKTLLEEKNDDLLVDFNQINFKFLQTQMIKSEFLEFDFHDGFYLQKIKDRAIPKILTTKIMNNIFNDQLKSKTQIKTSNKLINEVNNFIMVMRSHPYQQIKHQPDFLNFKNRIKRLFSLNDNKELLKDFNFHYISAASYSDWKVFIEDVIPNGNKNFIIPLVFTSMINDSEGFKSYLKDNIKFYFNDESHLINARFVENKSSLIHFLAHHDKHEYLKIILDKKPELINALDNNNETPIFYAAKNGNIESIKTLLKYNADLSAENKLGSIASEFLPEDKKYNFIFEEMENIRLKNQNKNKFKLQ